MLSTIGSITSGTISALTLYNAGDAQGSWVIDPSSDPVTFSASYISLVPSGWTRSRDDHDYSGSATISMLNVQCNPTYTKLKIELSINSSNSGTSATLNGRVDLPGNSISGTQARQVMTVPINFAGAGTIYITAYSAAGDGFNAYIYIYKIWLE